MRRRTYAISLVAVAILLVLLVALFVPLFGVEATPPDFQAYSAITTTQGNQTRTFTLVATPPTYGSTASLSYCLWGNGALLQNGQYYPFIMSHLTVEGAFCPTPQP